jgi:hypothetical protein
MLTAAVIISVSLLKREKDKTVRGEKILEDSYEWIFSGGRTCQQKTRLRTEMQLFELFFEDVSVFCAN